MKRAATAILVLCCLAGNPASVAKQAGQTLLPDADEWLSSLPPDSYTIQLATIYGLENCRSAQTEYQLDSMYCLESSTVPNRYFAITGVFPNKSAAGAGAKEIGVSGTLINYVPRIIKTRCEMPNPDARYQAHCANTHLASGGAATTDKVPVKLAQATNPAQTRQTAGAGESAPSAQPEIAEAAPDPVTESGEPSLSSFNKRVLIDIDSFKIRGENPLDVDSSYSIVNQFLGTGKGIADMEAAAKALEDKYRDLGHNFYGVSFPPQDVSDGSVELLVTRYKIGKVSVEGNKHYSDQNITGSLPQLRRGNSPNSRAMVRSLTLANQNSGKRTKLTLNGGQALDEIDATLTVVDQKPLTLSSWINNTGSDDSGNYRIGATVSHRNLFGRDHHGTFTFISSPQDVSDLQQYTLNYRIPIYELGGAVNLFAVKSNIDTGLVSEFFDIAGKGEVYGVGYTQVLSKKGEYRHLLAMQATDKLTDNDTTFMGEQVLVDIRSRPLSLTYQASWKNARGLGLGGSITATQNLGGGGQNSDLAYELSRAGADKNWNKFDLGASLQYKREKWLYTGAFNYSFSSDRLVTGEQFSIGGSASIRGMDERELRGDQGYRISLQAWAPPITKSFRPILFLDAGHVKTNDPLAGELNSESVSSLGIMLNWNPSAHINAAISYGYLLDGVDFGEDISTPASRDGDSKAHFNLSFRY